jgi:hypothetical protein
MVARRTAVVMTVLAMIVGANSAAAGEAHVRSAYDGVIGAAPRKCCGFGARNPCKYGGARVP